jgi:hypothetical protein
MVQGTAGEGRLSLRLLWGLLDLRGNVANPVLVLEVGDKLSGNGHLARIG